MDENPHTLSRRAFLGRAAMVGGGAVVAGWGVSPWVGDVFHRRGMFVYPDRPATSTQVRTIYSVCKQCGSDCGLAADVFSGVLQKLDGNPFHPASTEPHARYATPTAAAKIWSNPHSLCNRGQAGRQTLYDPYRLTLPLKRRGKRGSGSWEVISWEQLIEEVVSGGLLFSNVPGEETRHVEGFADLYDGGRGQTEPIDSSDPGLGPKTNGLVMYYGMAENGQTDFLSRFATSFGTMNLEAADAICDLNRMLGTMLSLDGMTDPMKPDLANASYLLYFGSNVMTGGFPMQAIGRKLVAAASRGLKYTVVEVRAGNSSMHSDRTVYVNPGGDGAIAMGMARWIIEHDAFDSDYLSLPGPEAAGTANAPTFTNASWLVVTDPKHPSYGSFLDPTLAGLGSPMGESGATGMGGQPSSAQGVVIDPKTHMPVSAGTASVGELWPSGALSTKTTKVNGITCQTSFQLLYAATTEYSLDEYAAEAGVSTELITNLAHEFTNHGRTAVADFGRGPAMHTNGFYACRAIMTLNLLIGNIDWMGGYVIGGGTADYIGANTGAPYNLGTWPKQPNNQPTGVPISRSGSAYESSGEYSAKQKAEKNPYPAQRPWFPFGGGQWPEMFAGIYSGYPYQAKILFQHAANPAWSAPAIAGADNPALPWQRLIGDVTKVPLFIATDIVLSESATYADYVVPDTSYLESWEFPGVWPVVPTKAQGIRQPVVESLTGRTASGKQMSMEQFLIDIAKALGLSGFGQNAFTEGGFLDVREDYYLKMAANVAYDSTFQAWKGGKLVNLDPVPDASTVELSAISQIRKEHPNAVSSTQWPKVAYVLARGGRFEDYEVAYLPNSASQARLIELVRDFVMDTGLERWTHAQGQLTPADIRSSFAAAVSLQYPAPSYPQWMTYRYGQGGVACQIYNQVVGTARNPISGAMFSGTARYEKLHDLAGNLLDDLDSKTKFPLLLSTHKTTVLSHSQSIADPWLTELMPESFIEMCPTDAARFGLHSGDQVRVWSPSLPREKGIIGRIRVVTGQRVGVIGFPHGYGHWQAGASAVMINGRSQPGDPARLVPVRLNAAMRLDDSLVGSGGYAVGLMDVVTGCQAYFDTRVALERV